MSQQSNADLRRYYRVANRKYFHNRLPKDLSVEFSNTIPCLGVAYVREPQSIEISEELRGIQIFAIMTLLHEMVHIENPKWKGHGWRWEYRMRELVDAGAYDGLL